MPRIEPLPAARQGLLVRAVMRAVRGRVGKEPATLAALARSRPTFFGQIAFELGLERASRVPERLKELAILKTAMAVGCEFCCDIGSHLARESGVSDDELRDLVRYRSSPRFDARDVAVLDLAVAMTRTPPEVDDALVARLREHFDDAQAVELITAVAWENFRARANAAMGFGSQGFSEGAFCVHPEVAEPAAAAVA